MMPVEVPTLYCDHNIYIVIDDWVHCFMSGSKPSGRSIVIVVEFLPILYSLTGVVHSCQAFMRTAACNRVPQSLLPENGWLIVVEC